MNLINYTFVQKLNFFLCIDINVINIQNISDKILKKTIVYFVQFFIFNFKNIKSLFRKIIFKSQFKLKFYIKTIINSINKYRYYL